MSSSFIALYSLSREARRRRRREDDELASSHLPSGKERLLELISLVSCGKLSGNTLPTLTSELPLGVGKSTSYLLLFLEGGEGEREDEVGESSSFPLRPSLDTRKGRKREEGTCLGVSLERETL